jgi:cholesterol transport system auxiliary component
VVVAQREFAARAPVASADAAGGARALAQASDTALGALLAWLPAPLK